MPPSVPKLDTQEFIDRYKRSDGVIDWYKVFDLPPTAPQEQIEVAFCMLSAELHPDNASLNQADVARYVLIQQGFKEIGDPEKRKKYDAFCRFQRDHARLLVTIDAAKQQQKIKSMPSGVKRIFLRVDSQSKRIALLAFPFFAVVAIYRLVIDLDRYSWQPSLSFLLFTLASILCLTLAFTDLSKWVKGK